jgi:hypothetical protein
MRQRRGLAGRADRNQTVAAFPDLPIDMRGEAVFVDPAVIGEGRYESGDGPIEHAKLLTAGILASAAFHEYELRTIERQYGRDKRA